MTNDIEYIVVQCSAEYFPVVVFFSLFSFIKACVCL
jgi:hypothetical protein